MYWEWRRYKIAFIFYSKMLIKEGDFVNNPWDFSRNLQWKQVCVKLTDCIVMTIGQ
jgi:hypothetical protein